MTNASKDRKGAFASRPALARLVATKRFLARLVLIAEQLLPMLLPLGCVIALFVAASWFGLFRILPGIPRLVLLAVFILAFLGSFMPFRRLRWPTIAAADRLLEERNGLPHQPVMVQEDEPAFETPFSRALWREHQTRMAEKIAALDAGLPRPDIASHDPYALRALPVLLLAVAFGFSMSNSAGTLRDAFENPIVAGDNPDIRVDAWVTPPSYTGQPPIYLTGDTAASSGPVSVPQFSELTVRITGGDGDETVLFKKAGSNSGSEIPLQQETAKKTDAAPQPTADAGSAPLAARTHIMKLDKGGMLSVGSRQWAFNVLNDKPPEIAFEGLPHATANGALEIGFKAKDDYGVDEAHAEIVPVDSDVGATPLYALPEYKFELSRRSRKDLKGLGSHDLTEDPLAGKRVRITLVARDGAGQTGRSPPYEMVMPGRPFSEPLAAAVAEERQVFALDTRKMPDAIALNEALTIRADETIPNLTHYLLL